MENPIFNALPDDLKKLVLDIFRQSLASILIGYTVATIFYGCSLVQTFIYFRVSTRDGPFLKASIFLLWLLDTAHTALLAAVMYIIVVLDLADLFQLSKATWTFSVAIFVTCVMELGVRSIFINRIWKLSRGNKALTIALSVITVAVFILSLRFGIAVYRMQNFYDLRQNSGITYGPFAIGLASDVAITGAQCVLLWRNRTGFTASDSIVRTLLVYILNTGGLIIIVTGGILISYAVSQSLVFMGVYLILPKTFNNALLASLNIRELIFGDTAELPAPNGADRKERRKTALARPQSLKPQGKDLTVRVETTTVHQIEDDKITDMWMPMQSVDKIDIDQKSAMSEFDPSRSTSEVSHVQAPPRCRPGMRRYM